MEIYGIAVLKEGDWMAVLFTSDLHLGHANIILTGGRNLESCGENFAAVEEMNDFLIRKWNEKVKEDDIVHLGRFIISFQYISENLFETIKRSETSDCRKS